MKASQVLYLVALLGVIVWIATSTHLLDGLHEGFTDPNSYSEPNIPKGVIPIKLDTNPLPNPGTPGQLPFGAYAQMASVGSYPYQDPSVLPAELQQMKELYEDVRGFLVFEGANAADSSDPTVQLPLTQLRADSRRLQQEIAVLNANPGIQSSLTQQDIANIQEALTFIQRKVRLFQNAGVVNADGSPVEGFTDGGSAASDQPKTRATLDDLMQLQTKIYGAILNLSSSGTTDPVVQARIKKLQDMYSAISDMINKVNTGVWTAVEIPLFEEDIKGVLPILGDPTRAMDNIFDKGDGKKLSPLETQLAGLVGKDNAANVFKNLQERGMFRVNVDLGYNVPGTQQPMIKYSRSSQMRPDGSIGNVVPSNAVSSGNPGPAKTSKYDDTPMDTDAPFDTTMTGMQDSLAASNRASKIGGLDWKARVAAIGEQIRLRGLDPQDYGVIPEGSVMSPAYSWRGHAKMICGRLAATMDSGLPQACGCPPPGWKGWTI